MPPNAEPAWLDDLLNRILRHHRASVKGQRTVIDNAFSAGVLLHAAKTRLPNGRFHAFLREGFGAGKQGVSVRMCQRYMKVAEVLCDKLGLDPADFVASDATRVSCLPAFCELDVSSIRQVLTLGIEEMPGDTGNGEQEREEPTLRSRRGPRGQREARSPQTPPERRMSHAAGDRGTRAQSPGRDRQDF